MAVSGKSESYYAASANPSPARPALMGQVCADVCVVGGGFTGISTALHLAERGYDVVLLEAETIGYGASGRSGGQIVSAFAADMDKVRAWVGHEDACRLFACAEEAKQLIADRVARHGIACDLVWGHVDAANKPSHLDELRAMRDAWARDFDYTNLTLLERSDLAAHIDSNAYVGGLYDAGGGHLHPLNYCLGLARAAEEAGARLFERSRVTALDTGTKPLVRTAKGEVAAQHLVICANAYLGNLVPELRKRVMPVGTYIGATPPLGEERVRRLLPSNAGVTDCAFVLDYFRRSGDHRLLFGGRVSYSTIMPPNLPVAMRRKMLTVFPQLSDQHFDYTWGGYVGITVERTPHLGRLGPCTYFAQGFSGHGVALTGMAGRLIAEAIAGQAERFDVMAKLPHTVFPGGRLLRTPTLALAMMWYRLRDMLG